MGINKKECFPLVIVLFLVLQSTCFFCILSCNLNLKSNLTERSLSNLNLNQGSNNFTVQSSLHELIWIEGRLTLRINSNQSGLITCQLQDSKNGKYFTTVNKVVNLTDNNETHIIRLITKPHITTLPGKYNLTLNISGLHNYSENFEVILGMGYIVLILIVSIFVIGLVLILVKTKKGKEAKPAFSAASEPAPSSLREIPSNKIKCPECKRLIDEGLSFCPECGGRIPEFLRFNPNSPRGL